MADARRDDRAFGLAAGAALAALGAWGLVRGRFPAAAPALAVAGVVLVAAALLRPGLLAVPRRAATALGELVAAAATRLVLLAVFVLAVTPIGLLRRLLGADPLRRRAPLEGSAWHPCASRHRDRRHFEKAY